MLALWVRGRAEWPGLMGDPKGLHTAKKNDKEPVLDIGAGTVGGAEVSLSSSLSSWVISWKLFLGGV